MQNDTREIRTVVPGLAVVADPTFGAAHAAMAIIAIQGG
jgi:hypothetical protein